MPAHQNDAAPTGMSLATAPAIAARARVFAGLTHQVWQRIMSVFRTSVVEPTERWRRLSSDMAELAATDERTLRDMGITRGDFPAIWAGTYKRETSISAEPVLFSVKANTGREDKVPDLHDDPRFFLFGQPPDWYERYWYEKGRKNNQL